MKIKQTLLEYLVRECIREVITQVREVGDEFKGAPTPPEKTGAGENPAIPPEKDTTPADPSQPETPDARVIQQKGLILIDPRNKSKLKKLKITGTMDDASLERALHNLVTSSAGPKVKIALATMRSIKDTIKNPNTVLYLYVGKFDPESEEPFLMADKSLQVAKDSTIDPSELGVPITPLAPSEYDPLSASPEDMVSRATLSGYARRIPGQEQPEDMDEPKDALMNEEIKTLIKKMVNDILTRK